MSVARRVRARRTPGDNPRTYRLANTVRLPFAVGAAALLVVALGTSLLVGRVRAHELEVPGAVRDAQAAVATEVAESVRRGLNEGLDDVTQLSREIDRAPDRAAALAAFLAIHGRYRSVQLIGSDGRVLAAAGAPVTPAATFDDGGARLVATVRSTGVTLAESAPVADGKRRVVAMYDPSFLRFPIGVAAPGDAWIVDRGGRVVSGLSAAAPATRLQGPGLDAAARRATAGRDGVAVTAGGRSSREIVAWTPIRGAGAAGDLGWGVVTVRRVDAAGLGGTGTRSQAMAIGAALALTTIAVFWWMRMTILVPLLEMQREAERLAYGDLSAPVRVRRYDDIGMIGRALERCRILLIRSRMRTP